MINKWLQELFIVETFSNLHHGDSKQRGPLNVKCILFTHLIAISLIWIEFFDLVSKEQHLQAVIILNGLDTMSNEFKNGKEMELNMLSGFFSTDSRSAST